MNMQFKKGMGLTFTIYKGVSQVEATGIYNALVDSRDNKKPVAVSNANFDMLIEEVHLSVMPNVMSFETEYEVKIRGIVMRDIKDNVVAKMNGADIDGDMVDGRYVNLLEEQAHKVQEDKLKMREEN